MYCTPKENISDNSRLIPLALDLTMILMSLKRLQKKHTALTITFEHQKRFLKVRHYYLSNMQAFANCLGGLVSVVGQQVQIDVEAVGGVQINSFHTKFKLTEKSMPITIIPNSHRKKDAFLYYHW